MKKERRKWSDIDFKGMDYEKLLSAAEMMAGSLDSSEANLAAERHHRGNCAFNARRIQALEAEIERLKKAEVK